MFCSIASQPCLLSLGRGQGLDSVAPPQLGGCGRWSRKGENKKRKGGGGARGGRALEVVHASHSIKYERETGRDQRPAYISHVLHGPCHSHLFLLMCICIQHATATCRVGVARQYAISSFANAHTSSTPAQFLHPAHLWLCHDR